MSENAPGCLELLCDLEKKLCEITGMDAVTLQPCAGAHGELTALMMAKKHFKGLRTQVIVPDTAHGTNPASAALCGFGIVNLPSTPEGFVDMDALKKALSEKTAVFMLTNPNVIGLFEPNILVISNMVHAAGGLMYCDGANMNAMLGITRPGDQGFDMMHLNLHKTFSVPHGGGGPGAGPVCVKKFLEPYLPVPRVEKTLDGYRFTKDRPLSIGRVHAFYGNFLALVRAYAYILSWGYNLKRVSEHAVLNANYVLHKLSDTYAPFSKKRCAHECVFSGSTLLGTGVHTMDVAKRLLDYGFHSPTIYFPLFVPEAMMIEPTETEDKATLDAFCDAMKRIALEARQNPELVKTAPHTLPVGRLDGVLAARKPNLQFIAEVQSP